MSTHAASPRPCRNQSNGCDNQATDRHPCGTTPELWCGAHLPHTFRDRGTFRIGGPRHLAVTLAERTNAICQSPTQLANLEDNLRDRIAHFDEVELRRLEATDPVPADLAPHSLAGIEAICGGGIYEVYVDEEDDAA